MSESFPRQQARTRRFSLGAPRNVSVAPDRSRVLFLRSGAGDDPRTALWSFEVDGAAERLVADPARLASGAGAGAGAGEDLPPEERARRERSRETAAGIVAYAGDRSLRRVAFALSGRLWWADVDSGELRELPAAGPVLDPRPDPTGRRVAYCTGGSLHVLTLGSPEPAGSEDLEDLIVAGETDDRVTWGQAEFIAAEEMRRDRGYWWAPDGDSLLATRVDTTPVATWWLADPAAPAQPPVAHRYPAAGTADAEVSLAHLGLDGTVTPVVWDRDRFPYLAVVSWTSAGPPLLLVESRDHTRSQVLSVSLEGGGTTVLLEGHDPAWVEYPPGVPAWLDDGRLVFAADLDDTRRLLVDGEAVTPAGLQVRAVLDVGQGITFTASSEPTEIEVWHWSAEAGLHPVTGDGGVAAAAVGGSLTVVSSRHLDWHGTRHEVRVSGRVVHRLASLAEQPVVDPRVRRCTVGERSLRVGIVLPSDHRPGTALPVLLCPYGGPSAQMVLAARSAWLEAQWLADQGFAVVVADGRGSPGRGPAWERAIKGDFATAVLEDQVAALLGAAEHEPALDTTRVGIRGWSFGGYLAALAVLRRPDIFHAAVAGAPVTDWRLYDTYYTERYLGHPDRDPAAYDRSSLLDDAASLRRPLLLVHGLADDNVVVAHTLRLSQRLLEAGRPHQVLLLSGVTHMASAEEVAESLLLLQVDFLKRALAAPA